MLLKHKRSTTSKREIEAPATDILKNWLELEAIPKQNGDIIESLVC